MNPQRYTLIRTRCGYAVIDSASENNGKPLVLATTCGITAKMDAREAMDALNESEEKKCTPLT